MCVTALLAACGGDTGGGPDAAVPARFEIVGHSPVNARGMNSALAVVGDTVYVGSRNDKAGVAIIDVSDPAAPVVVGEIGPPEEHLPSMSSRELRVIPERNLLIVLNLVCSPDLHGCATMGGEVENLKFFDITDRRNPVPVGRHDVIGDIRSPRSPHEMYIWNDATQALVEGGEELRVVVRAARRCRVPPRPLVLGEPGRRRRGPGRARPSAARPAGDQPGDRPDQRHHQDQHDPGPLRQVALLVGRRLDAVDEAEDQQPELDEHRQPARQQQHGVPLRRPG